MVVDRYINYKNKDYPVFNLYFQRFKQWYDISVESLANAISPDGTFDDADDEGTGIDQTLYFYIPDELAKDSKRNVMNYLNSQT